MSELPPSKGLEYTMLTPVPLTPDVLPPEYDHIGNYGLNLPCDMVFQYTVNNLVTPVASTSLGHREVDYIPLRTMTRRQENHENCDENEDTNDEDDDYCKDRDPEAKDPFSPHCMIPLPTSFSPYAYWLEPSFIRRRNERERQRVRNVNDGFERLKNHLPISGKDRDKRLSKVEILRMAIRYIRNLQDLLKNDTMDDSKENLASSGQKSME